MRLPLRLLAARSPSTWRRSRPWSACRARATPLLGTDDENAGGSVRTDPYRGD
ncbi:hypothetical protein [Streptomyces sp. NPDC088707]|uniref:hypothetical protein n=1 Tax=Streptomyces sp. NPDC088707 TaxID=3365871 RepID=UPI0037FFEB56